MKKLLILPLLILSACEYKIGSKFETKKLEQSKLEWKIVDDELIFVDKDTHEIKYTVRKYSMHNYWSCFKGQAYLGTGEFLSKEAAIKAVEKDAAVKSK